MTDEIQGSNHSENPPSLGRHREMLLAACTIVLLSLVLQVQPGGKVSLSGLPRYALPPSCISKSLFGLECPGCGLTRSLIHFAHGDWIRGFQAHRFGAVMAIAILLQFPYRIYGLCKRELLPFGKLGPAVFGYLLIAGLIGNWFYNQCSRERPLARPPTAAAR